MACHAAVELVRRIKLLNDPALQVRVGIHSGYVVAHVIEADFSSIYEAGGPAVHLVKRLESAAQAGQILVSESCQSLAAGLVTFNVLPPKRLEGFPAPVPCYELVEISGLTRWRARSTSRAFLLRRPGRRDFPARAGGAGDRSNRADRRAGGYGRHRKVPDGP